MEQPDNLKLVATLLKSDPATNRTQLAQELCRRLDLRDPKGDWQMATPLKALRDLETQGSGSCPRPRSRVPEPGIRGG